MRLLKIVINWTGFLTLPVWGGIAMFVISTYDMIKRRGDGTLLNALKGKEWLM